MKKHFGILSIELKWFKSYLSNREQQYSINDQLSSKESITCGWFTRATQTQTQAQAQAQANRRVNYQDANGNAITSADARKWKIFHFLALAFVLAFAFLTCEPDQRKRKRKRKVKNTRSRAFGNILFFSTKAAVIFKNKLNKQMAWADVASEVGLQNVPRQERK